MWKLVLLVAVLLVPVSVPAQEASGERGHGGQTGDGGEPGESGTRYTPSETARESRSGIDLVLRYDATVEQFRGTVRNTRSRLLPAVRVEVHLSSGVELGPTLPLDLPADETRPVELDAGGQGFQWFTVHVEVGRGEPAPAVPVAGLVVGLLLMALAGIRCIGGRNR